MPVQVALGAQAGLAPLLAPAVQVFTASAGAGMSVGVTAMLCGLLADGTRPAQLWRLLAPSLGAVLLLGWLSLALGLPPLP
jgi:lactate permease